ncbi:MAG: hypothetical protein ACT4QG_03260 [Sporichthyaceae bacterium]
MVNPVATWSPSDVDHPRASSRGRELRRQFLDPFWTISGGRSPTNWAIPPNEGIDVALPAPAAPGRFLVRHRADLVLAVSTLSTAVGAGVTARMLCGV